MKVEIFIWGIEKCLKVCCYFKCFILRFVIWFEYCFILNDFFGLVGYYNYFKLIYFFINREILFFFLMVFEI